MAIFMRAATDLNCTLSFHCRNNQPQLSFESNRTAANKLKGAEVCMTEMNDEVHIVMRTDGGTEIDKESWKKTDKAQFMWAIRGKCQKVLTQGMEYSFEKEPNFLAYIASLQILQMMEMLECEHFQDIKLKMCHWKERSEVRIRPI
ncbi:unnamed protein product [Onchocerca ochengi]|uniref:Uncharacterized protein n=1 Tax=Onchocerca ochengi TaxID=42157 RepID=A0A182EU48_ONCOC|nr:unnamed protein product [Onchocerca ochengi]